MGRGDWRRDVAWILGWPFFCAFCILDWLVAREDEYFGARRDSREREHPSWTIERRVVRWWTSAALRSGHSLPSLRRNHQNTLLDSSSPVFG